MFNSMNNGIHIKPKLEIVDNDSEVASYYPHDNAIRVSTRFIDIARNFKEDSINVVAHVLGHELAHILLQQNDFVKNIGTGYASKELSKQMKKMHISLRDSIFERQADEYASFYAHLSGYKTTHIGADVLDSIYLEYELNDDMLAKYPSLNERKLIVNTIAKRMDVLNQMFENSIVATLTGNYDMAISFLETIIEEKFPGKEVWNNLGSAYLLKGLYYSDSSQIPYLFPIQIDVQTNLQTRAGIADPYQYFNQALSSFENATRKNPNYHLAQLNKAIVEFLLKSEEFEITLFRLKKSGEFHDEVKLLEAFSLHREGETEKANEKLAQLKENDLAVKNYATLYDNFYIDDSLKPDSELLKELEKLEIPFVNFMSTEAKVSDTLRNILINGKFFTRRIVKNEKLKSTLWVSRKSASQSQLRIHEVNNILPYKKLFNYQELKSIDKTYHFANRKYIIYNNFLLIIQNEDLKTILIIE